jgi:hypothetical protein
MPGFTTAPPVIAKSLSVDSATGGTSIASAAALNEPARRHCDAPGLVTVRHVVAGTPMRIASVGSEPAENKK